MTLATLLAADPRPIHQVLTDAIHTLDAVHRQSKVDALRQDQERGVIDAETVKELISTARGASAVTLAATRTAAWTAIASSNERRIQLEAQTFARTIEYAISPVIAALEACGLSNVDADALRTWIGTRLREAIAATNERGQVPPMDDGTAPHPDALRHLAIVPRAELEALRDRARRHTPMLSDKPAHVFLPDDYEPDPTPYTRNAPTGPNGHGPTQSLTPPGCHA